MTPRPAWWLVRLLVAALLACAGCAVLAPDGPPQPPTDAEGRPIALSLPCDDGDLMDLGRPSVQGVPALFSTGGGTTYFSVSGFSSGGIFDPETWRAALLLGPVADLPTYDPSSGDVPQATVRSSVVEDTWTGVDLAPGRYWVSATNGAELTVLTCEAGSITEVAQAPGPDGRRSLAERHAWGGMCADGPCRSHLVVRTDGSWVLETESATTEGVLAPADLAGLEDAVAATRLGRDIEPSTGCAADSDGTSVTYVWLVDGAQPRSASSCVQAVAADDPLVDHLDRIAAEVTS